MKLLSSICYPNYNKGKLILINLEGAIHVKDHRKHPILYTYDVKHGFGSHAHTKRLGITTITKHQPVEGGRREGHKRKNNERI
jgi:hypothetical protein